ncbi:unnamed protein product [Cyclocybe aegerita]|uniref:Uncharacterized protein n=1 Tax=Cyclocybe aegerita TaxID=1973307 RepID=A0A8S0VRK2_CYCAE|nr:unnamed protein product [Cyclocybe aegerita]
MNTNAISKSIAAPVLPETKEAHAALIVQLEEQLAAVKAAYSAKWSRATSGVETIEMAASTASAFDATQIQAYEHELVIPGVDLNAAAVPGPPHYPSCCLDHRLRSSQTRRPHRLRREDAVTKVQTWFGPVFVSKNYAQAELEVYRKPKGVKSTFSHFLHDMPRTSEEHLLSFAAWDTSSRGSCGRYFGYRQFEQELLIPFNSSWAPIALKDFHLPFNHLTHLTLESIDVKGWGKYQATLLPKNLAHEEEVPAQLMK